MYKCSECGTEYEVKPDYCDCGNDTFIEEIDTKKEKEQIEDFNQFDVTIQTSNISFKKESDISSKQTPQDLASVIIFLICVILSLIIAFIPINNGNESRVASNKEIVSNKNMPNIDSFWNNAIPSVKQEEKEIISNKTETEKLLNKKQTLQQKEQSEKTTPIIPAQNNKKTVAKVVNPSNNATSKPKMSQQDTITTVSKKPVTQQSASSLQSVVPVVQKPMPTVSNQQSTGVKQKDAATIAAEKAKEEFEMQQELYNYKIGLRNAIARKIDFTKVIGDGTCSISFQINSSGQLISRAFKRQSDNITLNDAVFNAIKLISSYNPPPSAYKQETLILDIQISNGNFKIILN